MPYYDDFDGLASKWTDLKKNYEAGRNDEAIRLCHFLIGQLSTMKDALIKSRIPNRSLVRPRQSHVGQLNGKYRAQIKQDQNKITDGKWQPNQSVAEPEEVDRHYVTPENAQDINAGHSITQEQADALRRQYGIPEPQVEIDHEQEFRYNETALPKRRRDQ